MYGWKSESTLVSCKWKNGEGTAQHCRLQFFEKRTVYYKQWVQIHAEKATSSMENPKVRPFSGVFRLATCPEFNQYKFHRFAVISRKPPSCWVNAVFLSMKEELALDRLKGVKLWITAGPREKFTASEVMYQREKSWTFSVKIKC